MGGGAPCGTDAAWQVPWRLLYGYANRTDQLPLCTLHANRFADPTPLP